MMLMHEMLLLLWLFNFVDVDSTVIMLDAFDSSSHVFFYSLFSFSTILVTKTCVDIEVSKIDSHKMVFGVLERSFRQMVTIVECDITNGVN